MHQPGTKPGSRRWQRCILPLNHRCCCDSLRRHKIACMQHLAALKHISAHKRNWRVRARRLVFVHASGSLCVWVCWCLWWVSSHGCRLSFRKSLGVGKHERGHWLRCACATACGGCLVVGGVYICWRSLVGGAHQQARGRGCVRAAVCGWCLVLFGVQVFGNRRGLERWSKDFGDCPCVCCCLRWVSSFMWRLSLGGFVSGGRMNKDVDDALFVCCCL